MSLSQFWITLSHWLLPHTCILCKKISDRRQDLCTACLCHLPVHKNRCYCCGNPLPETISTLSTLSTLSTTCGTCQKNPPPFDLTHALYAFEPPVTRLLTQLKFYQALLHARLFGELLAEKIRDDWYRGLPLPDAILPVPLHPVRIRERGYNQTLEIAKPVAKALNLPILKNACWRKHPTLPQTTLSAEGRRQNVRHAFQASRAVSGLHLAVLDDVITTGSTISAFSQTLKNQGANRIDVWCCARV